MKKFWSAFIIRGLVAAAGGPVVLAIVYGILGATGTVTRLDPEEVCTGILSITVMAFIAAGITAVYQTERLPLLSAILIHAGVLYVDYLFMYLLNRWIPRDLTAISIFSASFLLGFALVWVCIYYWEKSKANQINKHLQNSQKNIDQ